MNNTSPSWVFRNVWALLDILLFPIVFLLLFIYHHIDKRRWKRPGDYCILGNGVEFLCLFVQAPVDTSTIAEWATLSK